ncbi:MAG: hypothetical protein IIW48_08535 [Clostridia bacterium]|nr:hypothetical protein [Clostridia bacterium]
MKKSILKTAAVLLALASIITVFTACKKVDENTLIYEEGGKIFYRKEAGDDAYELVTDENGVTVVDENGNLLWKVTDANGEEQTHPVSFPHYIQDGNIISCQQFSIKCPKGWENIGNFKIMLKNVDLGVQIDYSYIEPDIEAGETKATVDGEIAKLEKIFGLTAEITRTKTHVAGREAEKLVIDMFGDSPAYMEIYCVQSGKGIMSFNCTYTDIANKGTFDFKAVLDAIEYRI